MAKKYKPYPASKVVPYEDSSKYEYGEMWGTLDGQHVLVKDLRISHIKNIITDLEKRRPDHPYINILKEELKRRDKNKLIKTSKTGKLIYGLND